MHNGRMIRPSARYGRLRSSHNTVSNILNKKVSVSNQITLFTYIIYSIATYIFTYISNIIYSLIHVGYHETPLDFLS